MLLNLPLQTYTNPSLYKTISRSNPGVLFQFRTAHASCQKSLVALSLCVGAGRVRCALRITFLIESHPCEHHFTCRVNNTTGRPANQPARRPSHHLTAAAALMKILSHQQRTRRPLPPPPPCPILFNTACIIIYYKGRTGLDVTRIPKCNFAASVCVVCVQNSETGTTQYSMSAAAAAEVGGQAK
jgi:hypothetical protein